jgi:hypothetical protein
MLQIVEILITGGEAFPVAPQTLANTESWNGSAYKRFKHRQIWPRWSIRCLQQLVSSALAFGGVGPGCCNRILEWNFVGQKLTDLNTGRLEVVL